MTQFEHLFSPGKIGNVEVKNRIAVTAHATGLNPLGYPSDEFIAYNVEKAKNGVGLLMCMGSGSVHPTSPNTNWGGIHNWDDSVIPYFKKMSELIKVYGTVLIGQITHKGRRANRDVTWLPLYAPSAIPEPLHRDMPHEIQLEDIEWLIDSYVQAALRLKKGGFDGVEILAFAGHLIDQFWSPLSNKRTDQYGGSLENRMRFGLEVLDAVRDAVGDDFIISLRMSGDEFIEGGLTIEDTKTIALTYAKSGKLDLLNIGGSTGITEYHQAVSVPSMYYPVGIFTGLAGSIRAFLQEEGVDIPVLGFGRIVHPQQAEQILMEGQADFVGMNRAIIADPELPKKALEGRVDDIRICVGANEGCIGRIYEGKPIQCVQNPVIGREQELAEWTPAEVKKRVLIVGGGPAGLEAARMAALRGHEVTIFEKSNILGGQIRLATKTPHRESYASTVDWLESQVRKLGVEIKLEHEATVENVIEFGADEVIIATGSVGRYLDIPGEDSVNVITARDVLSENVEIGNRVLLIDEHHHQEGLSTAEYLAQKGCEVTVISRLWVVGEEIDGTLRPEMYARLDRLNVQIHPITNIKEIYSDNSVKVEHYLSHREWEMGPFDTIVVAAKGKANDDLWKKLKEKINNIHCIGDAIAARGLLDALLEGTRIARSI